MPNGFLLNELNAKQRQKQIVEEHNTCKYKSADSYMLCVKQIHANLLIVRRNPRWGCHVGQDSHLE